MNKKGSVGHEEPRGSYAVSQRAETLDRLPKALTVPNEP